MASSRRLRDDDRRPHGQIVKPPAAPGARPHAPGWATAVSGPATARRGVVALHAHRVLTDGARSWRLPHGRGVPTGSRVQGSRTRCTRASLAAAGRTSPSSQRMASACPGGTGADVPRLVQALATSRRARVCTRMAPWRRLSGAASWRAGMRVRPKRQLDFAKTALAWAVTARSCERNCVPVSAFKELRTLDRDGSATSALPVCPQLSTAACAWPPPQSRCHRTMLAPWQPLSQCASGPAGCPRSCPLRRIRSPVSSSARRPACRWSPGHRARSA